MCWYPHRFCKLQMILLTGLGEQQPGYYDKDDNFHLIPEMIPEFVVPDLSGFKVIIMFSVQHKSITGTVFINLEITTFHLKLVLYLIVLTIELRIMRCCFVCYLFTSCIIMLLTDNVLSFSYNHMYPTEWPTSSSHSSLHAICLTPATETRSKRVIGKETLWMQPPYCHPVSPHLNEV